MRLETLFTSLHWRLLPVPAAAVGCFFWSFQLVGPAKKSSQKKVLTGFDSFRFASLRQPDQVLVLLLLCLLSHLKVLYFDGLRLTPLRYVASGLTCHISLGLRPHSDTQSVIYDHLPIAALRIRTVWNLRFHP